MAWGTQNERKEHPLADPNRAKWHPILDLEEVEPGHWVMVDSINRPYAVIRMLKINGESGYRVVSWARTPANRELIGYYRTLRAAAKAGHEDLQREATPASPGNIRTMRNRN